MARRTTPAAALSVSDALALLTKLDPKRAATFDAATGTVRVMRRVHDRRADGTIIGFNSGMPTKARYEETRVDVRDAAAYAQRIVDAQAHNASVNAADVARTLADYDARIATVEGEIAALNAAAALLPEVARVAVVCVVAEKGETLVRLQAAKAEFAAKQVAQ